MRFHSWCTTEVQRPMRLRLLASWQPRADTQWSGMNFLRRSTACEGSHMSYLGIFQPCPSSYEHQSGQQKHHRYAESGPSWHIPPDPLYSVLEMFVGWKIHDLWGGEVHTTKARGEGSSKLHVPSPNSHELQGVVGWIKREDERARGKTDFCTPEGFLNQTLWGHQRIDTNRTAPRAGDAGT